MLADFTLDLPTTLWAFLAFLFLNIIYKFILCPYLGVLFYKNQGGKGMFFWELVPYLRNWQNTFKYGNFYHLYIEAFKKDPKLRFISENFCSKVNLILIDPAMVKELLMRVDIYERDWDMLGPFQDLVAESLGHVKGKKWKRSRRAISMAFNFEFMRDTVPVMVETARAGFEKWIKAGEMDGVDLVHATAHVLGEMTGRVIFGKDFDGHFVQGMPISLAVHKVFFSIFEDLLSPSPLSILFGPKFYKTNILSRHRKLNQMIEEIHLVARKMIDETEKSGKRENNLLWALLDLRKTGDENDDLTDAEILANFIGLFTGGSETSSHVISSAIYFLWKNPEVLRKVKEEVDEVFADEGSIKLEDMHKMEYTSNVIKETLRLGGPISLLQPRIAMRDDELCGVKIKKGTVVNYYHNVYYMNERYYPNPEEFNPDRWSAKSAEGHKEEPFANLPFSAGPRNCLGQHFAQIMIKMMLGMFVKMFDFEFAPGYTMLMTQKTAYEPTEPRKAWLRPKAI